MIKILQRLWNYIRVKNAIKYANALHAQTNKKYYVIQCGGKIRVLSRTQANYLVDCGYFRKCMRQDYYLQKYALYVAQ